jgi:AcrR family transcriptional regulator
VSQTARPRKPAPRRPRGAQARRQRTRLAPAARERSILDTARAIFEQEPYDTVTLEQIAAGSDVSPALVHHYFGTKRGVFMAVVRQAIDEFLQALAPPPGEPRPRSARKAVDGALERYLRFIGERPNGYAFVIGARGTPDATVTESISDGREIAYQAVLGLLGIAQPSPEQELWVWGWIGAVEAASARWLRQPTLTTGEMRELLLSLLLGHADQLPAWPSTPGAPRLEPLAD